LGSFQVFGISTDSKQSELLNTSRPVLVQPVARSSSTNLEKLLQVEFETNPLDKLSDYRVKVISQSLEIKYNAVRNRIKSLRKKILFFFIKPTINKLAECFEQDTQRNLQG
jgi:hypothetical protein